MRLSVCGMLVFVALTLSTPAFCLSPKWEQCQDVNNEATADRSLAACNRILNDHRETPNYDMALRNRCGIQYTKGNYDCALADCNQALTMEPRSAIGLNRRGLIFYMRQDNERAITDFNAALRLDPNMANALDNRGLAEQAKGDTEAGDADIARAKKINPDIGQ